MRPLRIVIDTNIWVSMLIGKRVASLISLIDSERIRIILSEELIKEIEDVTARPKFRKYFDELFAKGLLHSIVCHSEIHIINNIPERCRDSKDDYLLELSLQSNADFLVTGDDDLLVLHKIGNTRILSVVEFQKVLEVM